MRCPSCGCESYKYDRGIGKMRCLRMFCGYIQRPRKPKRKPIVQESPVEKKTVLDLLPVAAKRVEYR